MDSLLPGTPSDRFKAAHQALLTRWESVVCPKLSEPSPSEEVREAWDIAFSFGVRLFLLSKWCEKLASISAAIDEDNMKLCSPLAAVAVNRLTRQQLRFEARADDAVQPSFHQFTRLPAELRLMIWEAAANPPRCQHIVAIWHGAQHCRGPMADVPKFNASEPICIWFSEHDLGLWTACRDSRATMQRLYAAACERLAPAPGHLWGLSKNPCAGHVSTELLDKQWTRAMQLTHEGVKFQQCVRELDVQIRLRYLEVEHYMRKNGLRIETRAQKNAEHAEDTEEHGNPPREEENILATILRKFYEIDGELPRGADDGPIPSTALKRLRSELRMAYLLGVPWG